VVSLVDLPTRGLPIGSDTIQSANTGMNSGARCAAEPKHGDEIFNERPFCPDRDVVRKTELHGTGFPVRRKRRSPAKEPDEDPEHSL